MAKVLVVAENFQGALSTTAASLLKRAEELGQTVLYLLGELDGQYPAGQVYGLAGDYDAQLAAEGLESVVEQENPDLILAPATTVGNDLAGALAASKGLPVITEVDQLELQDGEIVATKTILGGSRIATMGAATPAVITVRPGAYRGSSEADPASVSQTLSAGSAGKVTQKSFEVPDASASVALEEAQIIVSGGRAMQGGENFQLLTDLAHAFGSDVAAVGSSRPAADAGWVPAQMEIGISGKTVTPDLYIACGISGASQHLAGMSGAKKVLVINNDPDASFFSHADYGVEGDLFEVVPALTKAIQATK